MKLHITYVIGYICLIIAAREVAVRNKMERYLLSAVLFRIAMAHTRA